MGGSVPLGYDPDGRTLTVNVKEAETVRTIYDLYLVNGSIREVKEQAKILDLRTRQRVTKTGKEQGGILFGRGNLYQILSNPIYAGKIRHNRQVFDGQHPAIIDLDTWADVQRRLTAASGRARGQVSAAHPPALAGKLYDETGDRLTPSHANKNGKRLRYYVSRRLVIDKTEKHPDAWRLPAPQLEKTIAQAARDHFVRQGILPNLVDDLKASEVAHLDKKLGSLARMFSGQKTVRGWSNLIERMDMALGCLAVQLNATAIADHLALPVDRLSSDALIISAAFQLRRRSVETKIILGNAVPEVDQILIRNIVKAMEWYDVVKSGKSFAQIATRAGVTINRVRHLIYLAFLAPDIIEQAINGTLPLHMTSDYLVRTGVPSDWNAQREMLANVNARTVRE